MRKFLDLKVWERSHGTALEVYRLTSGFPASERFGLTAQLRRAASSVPANIAEGSKRVSQRDFAHLLNVAEGSLAEVQYLLILSRDPVFATRTKVDPLLVEAEEILRMLSGLRKRVGGAS